MDKDHPARSGLAPDVGDGAIVTKQRTDPRWNLTDRVIVGNVRAQDDVKVAE